MLTARRYFVRPLLLADQFPHPRIPKPCLAPVAPMQQAQDASLVGDPALAG